MKVLTLCLFRKEGALLLGYKKRGFGQGKWNGFGGKIQEGESIREGAIRECLEECCLIPRGMQKVGEILFTYPHQYDSDDHLVHIFVVSDFEGTIQETEEMKPQWFSEDEIPFDQMWADDTYWLPQVLQGKYVEGTFSFNENGEIIQYELQSNLVT